MVDVAGAPLPGGWAVGRLGDIARVTIGRTPARAVPAYWGPGHPWASIGDLTAKIITATKEEVTPLAAAQMSQVPAGTLLMSFKLTLGRVAFAGRDMFTNEAICAIRNPSVDAQYLYYALGRADFARVGAQAVKGSTLNSQSLASLEIPVPPAAQQAAIARVLADLDLAIDVLTDDVGKRRAVWLAAALDLIAGRVRLPGFDGGWRTTTLGNAFEFLKTANNPRSDLGDAGEVGYIHYGDIHTSARVTLDCSTAPLPRIAASKVSTATRLRDGDLVVADASEDLTGIGKAFEIDGVGAAAVVAGLHTLLLRPKPATIAPGFGAYVPWMPSVRASLERWATGVSVFGISRGNMRAIALDLPPVEEQAAIATVLRAASASVEQVELQLAKTRNVKVAVARDLLTGRTTL